MLVNDKETALTDIMWFCTHRQSLAEITSYIPLVGSVDLTEYYRLRQTIGVRNQPVTRAAGSGRPHTTHAYPTMFHATNSRENVCSIKEIDIISPVRYLLRIKDRAVTARPEIFG